MLSYLALLAPAAGIAELIHAARAWRDALRAAKKFAPRKHVD